MAPIIAGVLMAGASVSAAQAEATMLKFSTMESPTNPMVQCFTMPFLDELKEASGGRIDIETYMGGSGFADPVRQYEQVARGVMDISQGVLSYAPGQFSMTELATMPLLVDNAEDMSRAVTKLAPEFLADEFKDIHLMAVLVTPALYVHQRDPLNGLDGLKGARIRSTGGGAKAFLEAVGAIPVQLPTPAVYENLQTGTIDGALSESLALKSFRISEVASNHLQVNVTSALLFLGMNKKTFDALPEDLQNIIKSSFSGPEVGARASACWNKLGAEVVEDLKAQGQTFEPLSDADQLRAKEIAGKVTADYISGLEAKGKPAQAFYDALIAELSVAKN
jgi:TRAP-type C4-dicarboxylate transport system substrate-binding protein